MFTLYAEVVFNHPLKQRYSYIVPDSLTGKLKVGMRAIVPFNKNPTVGLVISLSNQEPNIPNQILHITELPDPIPILNNEQLILGQWMTNYYLCSEGEALFKMFPEVKSFEETSLSKKATPKIIHKLNEEQERLYENLKKYLPEKIEEAKEIKIESFKETSTHLLYGITGSGKTEIYIHLLRDVLLSNHKALLLVPEISLTIQLIQRLQKVFGNELALLHSGLKNQVRFSNYLDLLKGRKHIGVGTRSAVFSPIDNLALIILDEEHDASFKENSTPRYDARQIAEARGSLHGGLVIFGSATPRIELTYQARNSNSNVHYHILKNRAKGASLPNVEMIHIETHNTIISKKLLHELQINFEKKEQSLLLFNRRGLYTQVFDIQKNEVETCPACSISLNLHKDTNLHCHYCGYKRMFDRSSLTEENTRLIGMGIQKLEELLLYQFKDVRIERLDSDTTLKKSVLEDTLSRFLNKEIDILIGTQMIARGLDAPNLTLVGVLQAERGLFVPDFRASEKTFSLLTQVAGRAGRDEKKGRVFFECFNVNNPIIKAASLQDYDQFYESELAIRKIAFYPPYSRIIRLLGRGSNEERIKSLMENICEILHHEFANIANTQIAILGPAEAPIHKINHKYKEHILIKTTMLPTVRNSLAKLINEDKFKVHPMDHLIIDFDPMDLS